MSNVANGYYMTEQATRRFRIWLLDNKLTLPQFAKKAECSRQYLERVLSGKVKVTQKVQDRFLKGGYELV